ncbi:glycosyl hydrolase family protein, partial [Pseudomonas savastanoi pv. glycinea str. race 4]
PWANKVGATLQAWFPGQQGGQAVAEILYGKVNPSGKLPVTIGM